MKTARIMILATMATCSLIAADLAGTWKGTMTTQSGETPVTITIKPGTTLTGRVQAAEYETDITSGKIADDAISFEMKIGPGTVAFEGKVSGNEMKLNVIGTQGDKYKLTCTRK